MDQILSTYVKGHLERGFRRIIQEQRSIALQRIYAYPTYTRTGTERKRSGRLREFLSSPSAAITAMSSAIQGRIYYPVYIRFLDMKKNGNHKIYNRPIWGILYKQTLKDIRYEFTEEIQALIAESLRAAIEEHKALRE